MSPIKPEGRDMTNADPRPLFIRALDQTQNLIDSVELDQLALPTPCPEYDVRTLLGHLLSVVHRIDLALSGGDPLTIPSVTDSPDIPGTWKQHRIALDETLADDSILGRICKLPFGTFPG